MDDSDMLDRSCASGLFTRIVGSVINFHDTLDSTNKRAKDLAEGGCGEGIVIVADTQTEGKGRMGRGWESPRGGLYLSVVLRPKMDPKDVQLISLVAGLAVSKAISTTCLIPTSLKWPNDLQYKGKKISGILTEASFKGESVEYIVLGIGINVNNSKGDLTDEVAENSISIREITGEKVDRAELLRNVLYSMDLAYAKMLSGQLENILDEWSRRSSTIGSTVRIKTANRTIEGKAIGVDQTGALIIKQSVGLGRVSAGECTHLDPC